MENIDLKKKIVVCQGPIKIWKKTSLGFLGGLAIENSRVALLHPLVYHCTRFKNCINGIFPLYPCNKISYNPNITIIYI